MAKGSGYTVEDLVFYTGLMGGIILVHFVLVPYEVHVLLRLLIGVVVGAGLGWLGLQGYLRLRSGR